MARMAVKLDLWSSLYERGPPVFWRRCEGAAAESCSSVLTISFVGVSSVGFCPFLVSVGVLFSSTCLICLCGFSFGWCRFCLVLPGLFLGGGSDRFQPGLLLVWVLFVSNRRFCWSHLLLCCVWFCPSHLLVWVLLDPPISLLLMGVLFGFACLVCECGFCSLLPISSVLLVLLDSISMFCRRHKWMDYDTSK